jgi:flagellar protein FlaG
MASVSASTLVIFIAAVGLAVAVSGTMVDSVSTISHSVSDRGELVSKQIDTDIEVISDAGSDAVYDDANGTVTLLVKNTGSRTLPSRAAAQDVLVDGEYVPTADLSVTVLDGTAWREGGVARLTIDRTLSPGEHRVAVVRDSETEVFEFYL